MSDRKTIYLDDAIDALYGITAYKNFIPLDSAIFNIKKLPSADASLMQDRCKIDASSDLISRQDAISRIQKAYIDTQEGFDKSAVKINVGLTKALHIMQDLPSAQQWIPVKWREPTEEESKYYTYMADCEMPEDGQEILVTDGKYVWKDECTYDDGFGLDSLEDWQNITAWMPLPEPWKGDEE